MVAARFLTIFLTLLPLALWGQLGGSWNHWATIPAEFIIAFFLFGIEEVGPHLPYISPLAPPYLPTYLPRWQRGGRPA